jgi:hypothetical protein
MSWAELSGEPKMRIAALLGGDTKAARLTCRGWSDMPPIAVYIILGDRSRWQQMQAGLSTADRLLLETQQQMQAVLFDLRCTNFRSSGIRCSSEWIMKSPPLEDERLDERLVQCLSMAGLQRLDIYNLGVTWEILNPEDSVIVLRSGVMEGLGRMTGLTHLELPCLESNFCVHKRLQPQLPFGGLRKLQLQLPFGGLTALETLNLSNPGFNPESTIGFCLRELPASLRRLDLSSSFCDFEGISRLTGLRELCLDGTHVAWGLLPLEDLAGLRELRVLSLTDCDSVPDDRSPLLPLVSRLDELNLNNACNAETTAAFGRTKQMDAFDAAAYCRLGMYLQVRTNHDFELIPIMRFNRV